MLIKLTEHALANDKLPDDLKEPGKLKGITDESEGKRFCGLYSEWHNGEQQWKSGYFIGACWLDKGKHEHALQITPKIAKIDYLKMFTRCLKRSEVGQQLNSQKIYAIDFHQPKIPLKSNRDEITPLLIVHFLQLVKAIVRKGLKKGYYPVRENLNARIKGKINVATTIKRNVLRGQPHKTVCDYQVFGLDCAENRLLKKALGFVRAYLASTSVGKRIQTSKKSNETLDQVLNYCLGAFNLVSDTRATQFKHFNKNAFYKEYAPALNLARMILKRFGYNLQDAAQSKEDTPPFWINMALLFELYVYADLLENQQDVKYQAKGHYGEPDFLIGDTIVDTKYKPTKYQGDGYEIDDIRQLSGYGRDKGIRKQLGLDNDADTQAKCLIIYPDQISDVKTLPEDLWLGDSVTDIKEFVYFKKIGIRLPTTADEF